MNRYLTPIFTSITPWSERKRNALCALSLSMTRGEAKTVITLNDSLVAEGVVIGRSTQTLN